MNNYFQTSCSVLAATLLTLGYKLDSLDRTKNPRRVEFLFCQDEGIDEAIQMFHRSEIQIEPQLFCSHQRILKSRLFAEQ
jgi:hypothetical protein